jgi:TfoX/Sxy family transcriptional regulator of competence genes
MAKEYFKKLEDLFSELGLDSEFGSKAEIKHFFSGAALYVNGAICASWSPSGLAFKLPEQEVDELIANGKAIPLKYFAKGHVKKGYAVFENPSKNKIDQWRRYFIKAAQQS